MAASPLFANAQSGQATVGPTTLAIGPSVPASCSGPTIFYKNSATTGMYYCDTSSSTFKAITGADANGVTAAATLTNGIPVLGAGGKAVASGPINLADTNSVSGVLPQANGGSIGSFQNGNCQGTIGTANGAAYVLSPVSNATNNACNITGSTAAAEIPMPVGCTAANLYVTSTVAGATAGSGIASVYKEAVATAVTCTLGTSTTCNDTTHTVTFTAGQRWSIRVITGQASDTTANLRAAFQCK